MGHNGHGIYLYCVIIIIMMDNLHAEGILAGGLSILVLVYECRLNVYLSSTPAWSMVYKSILFE